MTPSPPPGHRTGKIMAAFAWLLVLALLTWYFAGQRADRHNPNRTVTDLGDGSGVILRRNAAGHYLATGAINGRPVTFLVDTGATHVAVPLHMKHDLELEQGVAVPINTANGRATAHLTRIPELTLGSLHFRDVQGGLVPGMEGNEILLGMSVLSQLTITQQGDQLILRH